MACKLPEAISKIEEILSKNVEGIESKMLSGIQISMLNEAKSNLQSAVKIKMAKTQGNTSGSESKALKFDKKGFNGYVSIKDTGGKGSIEGDAKDKAMREVADGFVGEIESGRLNNSSTGTSYKELKDKFSGQSSAGSVTYHGTAEPSIVMLARNGSFANKPLDNETKESIKYYFEEDNSTFVVGDMPGVDTQFIEYLNEIGASYKVYTTNEAGKEFDRKGIDGSKYRELVETKPQEVETKSSEPDFSNYSDKVISFVDKKLKEINPEVKVVYSEDFFKNETLGYKRKYGSFNTKENIITIPVYPEDFNKNIEYYAEEVAFNSFSVEIQEYIWNNYKNSKATTKGLGRPAYSKGILINNLKELDSDVKIKGNITNIIEDFEEILLDSKDKLLNTEIHEKMHAIAVKFMRNNPDSVLTKRIEKLFEIAKNKTGIKNFDGKNKNTYWAKNVDEFVAESIGNQEIAEMLSKIDLNGNETSDYSKSIYKTLIDTLLNMLVLKDGNVYSELLRTLSEIPNEKTSEAKLSLETKPSEPDVEYGSVVKYKPENKNENKTSNSIDNSISKIFSDKLYSYIMSDFDKGNKDSAVEKIIKTYSSIETDTDENIDLKMKVNDRVRLVKGMSSALNDYNKLSRKMIEDLFGKNVERNYEIQPGITASKGQKNLIDTGIKFLEDKKNADNIGENIMIVQGRGGTGKTSSISRVLINYINENNFRRKPSIFMMTLSHQAKDVLNGMSKQISKETGIIPAVEVIAGAMAWYANSDPRTPGSKIEQRTVSFNDKKISYENKDAKREDRISSSVSSSSSGDIIVVDEASMLDSHELGYLLEKTKQGVKVILMGDYHQAKIVSPNSNNLIGFGEKSEYSKAFDNFTGSKDPLLKKATITELTEIHRQKEGSNILDFADYYADVIDNRIGNKKDKAIKPKANEKEVSYINRDNIVSEIVKDINNGKDAIYIAHTNRDVTVTNNEIRKVVSKDPESEYSVGDRMIAYANYSMQGEPPIITNSERLIVSKIENATNEEVSNEKAKQINGSRTYEFKYRTQDSSGKKIQYKKLTLQRKSYSDDSFNVTVIVPDGLLRKVIKAFENKATGSFDTIYKDLLSSYIYADGYQYGPNKDTLNFFSAGSGLSYGYAITAHKSQGSTVDIVYTTLPSDPNLAYVAITRAREKVNIVGKEDSENDNKQSEPSNKSLKSKSAGWKIHLSFKVNDDSVSKLEEILNSFDNDTIPSFKIGRNSGQEGKDATIYVGSADNRNIVVNKIQKEFSKYLTEVGEDAKFDDKIHSKGIAYRFDIGSIDSYFHQYGHNGLPALNEDIKNTFGMNKDERTKVFIESSKKSEKILEKKYGTFFTGTKEDSQSYNPQSEPDVDNNKYKIISKDDIEAAKDIMSNNKKECE